MKKVKNDGKSATRMKTKAMTLLRYFLKTSHAILIVISTSCLEPYNPPETTGTVDILVVDGFINVSDSIATVRLTKATPLSDNSSNENTVSGALVQIEDENGSIVLLTESTNGYYASTKMPFTPLKKYRVTILTNSDKRYFSDFVELTNSPHIDSVTWKPSIQSQGINILVNTHDDSGHAKYFQWTYDETWEYRSKYGAGYKLEDGVVVGNQLPIYRCWISKPSSEILIGSTAQLSTSAIRDYPLAFIPVGSQKLTVKYSILVQQRVLTKEAYDFWLQLKKSTESLGGLFDPLPSQVLGNLHSADNDDAPVLGYFSGGQVASKRVFIAVGDLPPNLRSTPFITCEVDSIGIAEIGNYPDMFLITMYGEIFPEGYTTSGGKNCMDCRDDGGDLERPDFWN